MQQHGKPRPRHKPLGRSGPVLRLVGDTPTMRFRDAAAQADQEDLEREIEAITAQWQMGEKARDER